MHQQKIGPRNRIFLGGNPIFAPQEKNWELIKDNHLLLHNPFLHQTQKCLQKKITLLYYKYDSSSVKLDKIFSIFLDKCHKDSCHLVNCKIVVCSTTSEKCSTRVYNYPQRKEILFQFSVSSCCGASNWPNKHFGHCILLNSLPVSI